MLLAAAVKSDTSMDSMISGMPWLCCTARHSLSVGSMRMLGDTILSATCEGDSHTGYHLSFASVLSFCRMHTPVLQYDQSSLLSCKLRAWGQTREG